MLLSVYKENQLVLLVQEDLVCRLVLGAAAFFNYVLGFSALQFYRSDCWMNDLSIFIHTVSYEMLHRTGAEVDRYRALAHGLVNAPEV